MDTRIQKWGNSLGVRIPKEIINKTELREGSCVKISNNKGRILIEECAYELPNLKSLVRKISPSNLHKATGWDNSYGKEAW